MKLAIENLSLFSSKQIASKVFLNNLKKTLKDYYKCNFTNYYMPFYDIALFATTNKSVFNKPFILRLDGIYIDKLNTIKNSDAENDKIFDSIKKSSGVIFNSSYSKNIVEKFYKKIEKPTAVIYNGIDQTIFNSNGPNLRKKLGIDDSNIVLISCAVWRRHKRLEETIKFFEILKAQKKKKLKLIIIGSNANNAIVDPDIIFSGYIQRNELPAWYRSADIYLHLSWIEANSNSQSEAISCGLPVLCSNNGGNHEIVTDSYSGIVSQCDKEFNYSKVDLYHPPEPDYKILLEDFNKLLNLRFEIKKKINLDKLNIIYIAKQYYDFIKKVYKNL
jgi:glycosyltransferase involved in cell wall biosynthesis